MLTISDNVATDELIALAGLDEINRTTRVLHWSGPKSRAISRHAQRYGCRVGFEDFSRLRLTIRTLTGSLRKRNRGEDRGKCGVDPTQALERLHSKQSRTAGQFETDRAGDPIFTEGSRDHGETINTKSNRFRFQRFYEGAAQKAEP